MRKEPQINTIPIIVPTMRAIPLKRSTLRLSLTLPPEVSEELSPAAPAAALLPAAVFMAAVAATTTEELVLLLLLTTFSSSCSKHALHMPNKDGDCFLRRLLLRTREARAIQAGGGRRRRGRRPRQLTDRQTIIKRYFSASRQKCFSKAAQWTVYLTYSTLLRTTYYSMLCHKMRNTDQKLGCSFNP